jgi:chemotaxis protein MotB
VADEKAPEKPHEILIIKRSRNHEDGSHGGAWKIAFADFMTAMMALFLVLWLISATNEKTKASLARYFNPVKLVDMTVQKRGLNDPEEHSTEDASDNAPPPQTKAGSTPSKTEGKGAPPGKSAKPQNTGNSAAAYPPTHSEANLFRDPYAVLAEIVATGPAPKNVEPTQVEHPNVGAAASFQDPFQAGAPEMPERIAAQPTTPATSDQIATEPMAPPPPAPPPSPPPATEAMIDPATVPAKSAPGSAVTPPSGESAPAATTGPAAPPPAAATAAATDKDTDKNKAAAPKPSPVQQDAQKPAENAVEKPAEQAAADQAPPAAAASTANKQALPDAAKANAPAAAATEAKQPPGADAEVVRLQTAINDAMGKTAVAPTIQVKPTPEGVVISLTDGFNYAMFAIGSAEPQPRTVLIMEKVAQILKKEEGAITITGHTDGRRYKSRNFDNWRLSEARAQMALYMLVRGGLDEKRVIKIEGAADHALKVPNDPMAAENRRIEILLKKSQP